MHDPNNTAVWIVVLVFYFFPTLVAEVRRTKHQSGIAVVNIFLGWTVLGWVGALAWAVSDAKRDRR